METLNPLELFDNLSTFDVVQRALDYLAPSGVQAAICPIASVLNGHSLMGVEKTIAVSFGSNRRQEFAAGRSAAREALRLCGCETTAIPRERRGNPVWPEGFTGSISHCNGIAVAVAVPTFIHSNIGIDIARKDSVDPKLAHMIRSPEDSPDVDITLLFSIKESGFKCVYSKVGKIIDFVEATVELDERRQRFTIHPSDPKECYFPRVEGSFALAKSYWCTFANRVE